MLEIHQHQVLKLHFNEINNIMKLAPHGGKFAYYASITLGNLYP